MFWKSKPTQDGSNSQKALLPHMPPRYRGTSVQVCGLWPWSSSTGAPMVGVPIGRHLDTGASVCCDPLTWFARARIIANPSMMVLGKPGLGKSTFSRRIVLGLAGFGITPMVLGDLKPDYVDLIRAMGGQVIELGGHHGALNILDPGESSQQLARLPQTLRESLKADAHSRRQGIVSSLITILRSAPPEAREETILDRALSVLTEKHAGVPVLTDLIDVIRDAPQDIRTVALDRGNIDRYRDLTENLEVALIALAQGKLGTAFGKPTTEPIKRGVPLVFDASQIPETEIDKRAAALVATWNAGFASIEVSNTLAEAGLEPQRNFHVTMDELWYVLRAGRGMVDRIDSITRLNRQKGVSLALITHSLTDMQALPSEEDRLKAKGFVERAGMVVVGGVPRTELKDLTPVVGLSKAEQDLVSSWTDPETWGTDYGDMTRPDERNNPGHSDAEKAPGLGKFLVKVGNRPGIPVQMHLTQTEQDTSDTNRKWHNSVHTANSEMMVDVR